MPTRNQFRAAIILVLGLTLASGTGAAQMPQAADSTASLSPPVWRNVQVTDAQGWQIEAVQVYWVGDGRALRVERTDGATRDFAPDRIQRIHNALGADITADVAAGRYEMPQPPTTMGPRGSAGPTNREFGIGPDPYGDSLNDLLGPPLFQIALDAGLGFATHTGTWFLGLDDGMNYQAGARFGVGPRQYLRLLFRHQDMGTQSFDYYDHYEGAGVARIDVSVREYQFLFGRHGPVHQNESLRTIGYVEYGLSVMDHRFSSSGYQSSDSVTKLGWVLQGGVMALLNDTVALDFSAGVTWKAGLSSNETGGLLLGVHAALVVMP